MNTITMNSAETATSDSAVTRERRYISTKEGPRATLRSGSEVKVSWNVDRGAGWQAKGWRATRSTEAEALAFAAEKWAALVKWVEAAESNRGDGSGAVAAFSAQVASMMRWPLSTRAMTPDRAPRRPALGAFRVRRPSMITAIQAYMDAHDAGPRGAAAARDWLSHLPPAQIAERFEDFAPRCPDSVSLATIPRPANALNVEIGTPQTRCRAMTPGEWGSVDPSAVRWLASGGSPLVLGPCSARNCPRAKSRR